MKRFLIHLCVFSALCLCTNAASADDSNTQTLQDSNTTNAAPIVVTTLFEDGSTNTWTQTDLTDALGLMNRKYHRDMESESGRTKWHGKRMSQYLIEGNGEQGTGNGLPLLVTLYEDGFAWTSTPQRVSLKDPESAAKAKASAEARQAEWERTHLPPDVAALLQRRRDAQKQ